MAEEARRAVSPRIFPRASGGQDSEASGPLAAGREMRFRMGPVNLQDHTGRGRPPRRGFGAKCRWETENGWTGGCAPDCWHASSEAALACFRTPRTPG